MQLNLCFRKIIQPVAYRLAARTRISTVRTRHSRVCPPTSRLVCFSYWTNACRCLFRLSAATVLDSNSSTGPLAQHSEHGDGVLVACHPDHRPLRIHRRSSHLLSHYQRQLRWWHKCCTCSRVTHWWSGRSIFTPAATNAHGLHRGAHSHWG